MSRLELAILHLVRTLGGFALAKRLTRNRLRILCYHGFSLGDEHEFIPYMFMRAETFERRLRILQRRGIPILSVDAAITMLRQNRIRNAQAVITLDDGWSSNLTIGAPLLLKYGYPACVYVTTEHLEHRPEVFNVILLYLILRSGKRSLTLSNLHPAIDGTYDLSTDPYRTILELIGIVERAFRAPERFDLLAPIASALDLDLKEVLKNDRFRLVDRSQIQALLRHGIDIQLHTHTHRLPSDAFEAVALEISRNREVLGEITGTDPRHFCYPSGIHAKCHPDWLTKLGIASATTCDPGLNAPGGSVMLLKRYLDDERTPDIRFEAEICGVGDLLRRVSAVAARAFRQTT